MKNRDGVWAVVVVMAVLLVDQLTKFWVKTNMMLGDEILVLDSWFRIHFVENNGMAFGFELSGGVGKLALSLFRIVAVVAIGWYIVKLCRRGGRSSLVVCVSLVLAGAIGNIIDSVFYGVIFNSSWGQVATLFPPEGGYSTWLHGRVVDMLYFPLVVSRYPDWFPFFGGESLIFFRPVFNVADAAISVGIVLLLLFHREALSDDFAGSGRASEAQDGIGDKD